MMIEIMSAFEAGNIWSFIKAVVLAAFIPHPEHLFAVLFLFFLDLILGYSKEGADILTKKERRRAVHIRLFNMAAWLAIVLILTNTWGVLLHFQPWIFMVTALFFAGKIVKDHLNEDIQQIWIQVEGRLINRSRKSIRKGDVREIETTIKSEQPADEGQQTEEREITEDGQESKQ